MQYACILESSKTAHFVLRYSAHTPYLYIMILYNVTVNIDDAVHDDWVQWMREIHIPEVLATGLFIENRFCKIEAFEQGGKSYSVQYLSKSREDYERYQNEFAADLQAKHIQRYNGKFAAFRTVLEVIDIKSA